MKRIFENGHHFDEIANSKHLRQKKDSKSPQLTTSERLLTSWLKGVTLILWAPLKLITFIFLILFIYVEIIFTIASNLYFIRS